MQKHHIVCRCNMVEVGEVEQFVSAYPDMPIDQMKYALNIGTRCGCCQTENCPTIDVKFEHVINHINKSI